ncbi:DUF3119 family protein [cyanobacterium endosymbiont of Rhopalodia gibberula]
MLNRKTSQFFGVQDQFYFRDVNNIHFLPITFNFKTLKNCL